MLGVSIVIFSILAMLLLVMRPSFLINEETGDWKQFGVGKGKSCMNVSCLILVIALFSYLLAFIGFQTMGGIKKMLQRGGGDNMITATTTAVPSVPSFVSPFEANVATTAVPSVPSFVFPI
jgi:hypothetical protein